MPQRTGLKLGGYHRRRSLYLPLCAARRSPMHGFEEGEHLSADAANSDTGPGASNKQPIALKLGGLLDAMKSFKLPQTAGVFDNGDGRYGEERL